MSLSFDSEKEMLKRSQGKVFTFNEAIEFEKFLYNNFTYKGYNIKWINVKTGKEVGIGWI